MLDTRWNYFVPGIYSRREDPKNWDFQAQLWCYDNDAGAAAGFHYSAGALWGIFVRSRMTKWVAEDLTNAREVGFSPIKLIGHSNGCRIATAAVAKSRVDELHLIAPAMPRDCRKNGLNRLALDGLVDRVFVYESPLDEWLGVGGDAYGDLGKYGPTYMCPELDQIMVRVSRECRHSDWVSKYFEETMQFIAKTR